MIEGSNTGRRDADNNEKILMKMETIIIYLGREEIKT